MDDIGRQTSIQLRDAIQAGAYAPKLDQVAASMLKRPGLRLLFGDFQSSLPAATQPAGRSRPA